jgi:hypothetical protein
MHEKCVNIYSVKAGSTTGPIFCYHARKRTQYFGQPMPKNEYRRVGV